MHSCLYEGIVTHRRREPVEHRFQYRLFMVYLDLDELPTLVHGGGLIGRSKYASRSFLRSDQLFDASMTLDRRELSQQQLRRMTFLYPLMTAPISAAIYFQALKLWWKQCPFYPHPNQRTNSTSRAPASPNLSTTTTDAIR